MLTAEELAEPYEFWDGISLEAGRSRASQIYAHLRVAIIALALPPGAAIRKEEIAGRFGVSRTPVSEALVRLAEEGLVEVVPQRGTFVSRIRVRDMKEGAFLREALEVAATREVAATVTDQQILSLRRNLRHQKAALDDGDLDAFHAHDEEMHGLICEFIGFPKLRRIVDSSRAQLDRARRLLLPVPGRGRAALREHKVIVDALAARDPEAAADAMRYHLQRTPAILSSMIAERPDLFDEG